jgi:uncharacterized protein YndB with AHSA1/START domain
MTMPSDVRPDRDLFTSRVIDAPREQVFAALADPARLARWWGPAGFSSTFQEFDLRPDGRWRFVMHGPNGGDYQNESVFREIVRLERVAFDHVSPPRFTMTISLADEAGRTRVTWHQRFPTPADCDKVRGVAPAANEQNLDRLAAEVARSGGA